MKKINDTKLIKNLALACALLTPMSAQSLSLDIVNGQLMGATGVKVGDAYYDVSFVNGTCVDVFSGCNEVSDFAFSTSTDALLASQALLDTVFLDGPSGQFDSAPELTNGITADWTGAIWTPYGFSTPSYFMGAAANNWNTDSWNPADGLSLGSDPITRDFTNDAWHVWADWSTGTVTSVPVPPSLFLFFSGLAGFLFMRRSHTK